MSTNPGLDVEGSLAEALGELNSANGPRWRLVRGISNELNFGLRGLEWIRLEPESGETGVAIWLESDSIIWIVLDPGESRPELAFEWWPNHRYRESLAFVLANLCLGNYEVKSVRGVDKVLIGSIRLPLAASKVS